MTRSIHKAPLFIKPPVAKNPFTPAAENPPRNGDGVLLIMKHLIGMFELSRDGGYLSYSFVAERWRGSRVMLDLLIEEARSAGLIKIPAPGHLEITLKGKMYAVENLLAN